MRLITMLHEWLGPGFSGVTSDTAQFVDITPVARWFFENSQPAHFDLSKDFPSLAVPWPLTWMEFVHPPTVRVGSEMRVHPKAGRRAGALLSCERIDDGEQALLDDVMDDFLDIQLAPLPQASPFPDRDHELAERRRRLDAMIQARQFPRWLLDVSLYEELGGRRVAYVGERSLYLDELGRAFGEVGMARSTTGLERTGDVLFAAFAYAVSFLHCKNMILAEVSLPPKVQRRREKRGKLSFTFKTLTVEPLSRYMRRHMTGPCDGEQAGAPRALHIARGHFKDYREGGGLFGKLHGLYWWDMHVRGSAAAGAVIKDYRVRPGQPHEA